MPVEAAVGSAIRLGSLRVRDLKARADTRFRKIVKLVEEAEAQRAEVQCLGAEFRRPAHRPRTRVARMTPSALICPRTSTLWPGRSGASKRVAPSNTNGWPSTAHRSLSTPPRRTRAPTGTGAGSPASSLAPAAIHFSTTAISASPSQGGGRRKACAEGIGREGVSSPHWRRVGRG